LGISIDSRINIFEVLSMAPRFRVFGWVVPLVMVVLWAAEGGQTCAQTLNEGWDKLDREYSKVTGRIRSFRKGEERVDPNDPSHVGAIDLLAKYHTYRVCLDHLENPNPPPKKPGIDRAYKEFEGDVRDILGAKNPQAIQPFAEVFRDKIRIHALEVLEFDQAQPIHKVYNARVLAKVAELKQGALTDTLIKVLKDSKQNDAVHYYILRGMRTLAAQTQPSGDPVLTKEEQVKCASAIVEFLEQKKGPAKNASPEEVDGFCWLRREAIRALAQIHTPAVNDKVRPALVLARFAGNDERIQPPPRIDERVEAAIGLARMEPGKDKQYQADYAAGQIAKCLGAFAQLAESERNNNKLRTHPWRVDAAMLKDALAVLKTNNDKNAFVTQVADRGMKLLDNVIKGAEIDANERTWWSSPQSDPQSKELFRDLADSAVKPAQPAESAPEK
jgi:hypothetical protein